MEAENGNISEELEELVLTETPKAEPVKKAKIKKRVERPKEEAPAETTTTLVDTNIVPTPPPLQREDTILRRGKLIFFIFEN